MAVQNLEEETDDEIPSPLTASDRFSFAYPTMKDRVPVIICKVIDLMHRNRASRSPEQREELKDAIEEMAKLRYELQTNKPFRVVAGTEDDVKVWNDYLEREIADKGGKTPTWFETRWLYAECYAYRRLLECFSRTKTMRTEDYFEGQKRESFRGSWAATQRLLRLLGQRKGRQSTLSSEDFLLFLKMSLWGNKCDLSITSGSNQAFEGDPDEVVDALARNVVVDQSIEVYEHLTRKEERAKIVDLVLDNVGFELVSDLALADFLVSSGSASKVRLRVKNQPWFVSDVMSKDLAWTLDEMSLLRAEDDEAAKVVVETVAEWRRFLDEGIWIVVVDPFWTYPHHFNDMKSTDGALYESLSEADLVIFKGDLNYRKLVGDLAWKPIVSFEKALRQFRPAPLVALRTIKADVATGLVQGQEEALLEKDKDWMINGNWAVIQFCDRLK